MTVNVDEPQSYEAVYAMHLSESQPKESSTLRAASSVLMFLSAISLFGGIIGAIFIARTSGVFAVTIGAAGLFQAAVLWSLALIGHAVADVHDRMPGK